MATTEVELKRLLHFGRETPFYQPGDRLHNESYHTRASSSIENLEKLPEAPNCILKAYSDGYSAHPSMLVYALAICARKGTTDQIKEATYKAIKTVCSPTENLFLYIKFACKLSQNKSLWSTGFRKVCKEWYLKKDPKTLAEIVSKHKKNNGWLHKDVIKLIHLKADGPAKAAIIKYLLFDLKTAKKEFGENPEACEILNYLQAVEDFKHMTDEQQAARSIEIHHFDLEQVPSHLLKSKEVWGALIENLSLPVLLKNLERIGYLGFLKPNSTLAHKVIDALNNENAIAESHIHPAQVFIALRNYEMSSKFLAVENAMKKQNVANGMGEPKKLLKVPPKPNPKIISTLYNLFSSTCKFLAPTGLRYLVAIDVKSVISTDKCYLCPHVSPAQATAVISLCLLHAEQQNVSIFVSGVQEELKPLNVSAGVSTQQFIKSLEESGMQRMKISTPLDWSLKKKQAYDIFILITDTIHKANNNVVASLQKYREEMNIPNVKSITVLLKCHFEPTWVNEVKDPGVFVIAGFDGNVPRLIEAFSRGAF